jgi:hypothetical protein
MSYYIYLAKEHPTEGIKLRGKGETTLHRAYEEYYDSSWSTARKYGSVVVPQNWTEVTAILVGASVIISSCRHAASNSAGVK